VTAASRLPCRTGTPPWAATPASPEAEGVLRVSPGPAPGPALPLRRAARPGRSASPSLRPAPTRCRTATRAPGSTAKDVRMRSVDTTGLSAAPAWSDAELVELTIRLALGLSTAPADRPWSVPLLVTPEVEAWLLGWPAGLVTPAHDHGRAVALTVVEGSLSEECLDPTIWTTGRRHAWSGPAGSGGRGAGRLALARGGAGGRGPGRGRGPAEPVGVGGGRGGDGCLAGHPAHRALDLEHVRDRVAG
jgi:hypothetical protein